MTSSSVLWQPLHEQFMGLTEEGCCLTTNHRQHGLYDTLSIVGCKTPLLQRRPFDLEEGIKIGYCQVKCSRRQDLVDHLTIICPNYGSEKSVERPYFIAPFIHTNDRFQVLHRTSDPMESHPTQSAQAVPGSALHQGSQAPTAMQL